MCNQILEYHAHTIVMAVSQARVVIDEDPNGIKRGADRSPWTMIPPAQFRQFSSFWNSSTGCASSCNAIVQGTLGAEMLISGEGWKPRELINARVAFRTLGAALIKYLHMHGIAIVAVDPFTRLPSVVDPLMLRIWHSITIDGRSLYIIKQAIDMAPTDEQPLSGVAVFELSRPRLGGLLDSPLLPCLKNWRYVAHLMRAGAQAAFRNADPTIFQQREVKEETGAQQVQSMDYGVYNDHITTGLGEVAARVMMESARDTYAAEMRTVDRVGRHRMPPGLHVEGAYMDSDSGTMQFAITHEPNLVPLPVNESIASAPLAQAPPDLQAAIIQIENDIARVFQIPATLWGDGRSGAVTQTALIQTFRLTCIAWSATLVIIFDVLTDVCRDGAYTGALRNDGTEAMEGEEEGGRRGSGKRPRETNKKRKALTDGKAPTNGHKKRAGTVDGFLGIEDPATGYLRDRPQVVLDRNPETGRVDMTAKPVSDELLESVVDDKKGKKKKKKKETEQQKVFREAGERAIADQEGRLPTEPTDESQRARAEEMRTQIREGVKHIDDLVRNDEEGRARHAKQLGRVTFSQGPAEESGTFTTTEKPHSNEDESELVRHADATSESGKGNEYRRKLLTIRLGAVLDVFAIREMYEEGRITFEKSQEYISAARGIALEDLTRERLDPIMQEPMAKLIKEEKEEQKKMEVARLKAGKTTGGGGAAKKPSITIPKPSKPSGGNDPVREPGKMNELGEKTGSLRATLTKQTPSL